MPNTNNASRESKRLISALQHFARHSQRKCVMLGSVSAVLKSEIKVVFNEKIVNACADISYKTIHGDISISRTRAAWYDRSESKLPSLERVVKRIGKGPDAAYLLWVNMVEDTSPMSPPEIVECLFALAKYPESSGLICMALILLGNDDGFYHECTDEIDIELLEGLRCAKRTFRDEIANTAIANKNLDAVRDLCERLAGPFTKHHPVLKHNTLRRSRYERLINTI